MAETDPAAPPAIERTPVDAPPAALPKKSRRALKIAIGLGLGAAILGGGAVLAYKFWPKGGNPLPFEASALPPRFGSIAMYARYDSYASAARTFSQYATWCGGTDLYGLVQRSDAFYATEELATLIRDAERTRAYLRCGKHIAETSSGASYVLEMNHEYVNILASSNKTLVVDGTFQKHSHNGFTELWCRTAPDNPCGAGIASGRLSASAHWMFGPGKMLEAFGDGPGEASWDSKDLAKIRDLAKDVEPYPNTSIGGPTGTFRFDVFESLPVYGKEVEAVKKAFESKLSDLGAYWATGSPKGDEGEARLEIIASSEHDAHEILSALRDYRAELKHLESDDLPAFGSIATTRYWKTMGEITKRALADADPEQDEDMVRLVLELKPEKDEPKALARFQAEYKKKTDKLAQLIYALIDGREPEEGALRSIGGRALWLAVQKGVDEGHRAVEPTAARARARLRRRPRSRRRRPHEHAGDGSGGWQALPLPRGRRRGAPDRLGSEASPARRGMDAEPRLALLGADVCLRARRAANDRRGALVRGARYFLQAELLTPTSAPIENGADIDPSMASPVRTPRRPSTPRPDPA
jgi:hypothetical protein